ncbi:MAG: DMT family transporter [Oscillospiraceae bacterium]|nr:DMT family transporter [Oscillospiraceae bacterium]
MHPRIRETVLPLLAAAIWGSAFVGQSIAGEYLPPFAVNAARSVVAVITLAIVIWGFRRWETVKNGAPKPQDKKKMITGGILCGTVLTIASNLQQIGLVDTSAGKASFITALYIVIVPLCSIFAGRKLGVNVWCAVALATAGLYFLCIQSGFTVQKGDFFVFLCALFFSAHILVIDHYTRFVDGIYLSFVQFFTCMVISGVISLLTEEWTLAGIQYWILPILYVGIFSSGVAYTLQIIAQTGTNPAVVSILLSLESVFGVISGAIVLHERMSGRELLGCGLMFAAVILSQLPEKEKKAS